jgi:hypothetical protein
MAVALNAVLDRLPNLRWDPEQPRPLLLGTHMRGPTPSRSSSDDPHPDVEERSTMIRTTRSNSMAQWIRS